MAERSVEALVVTLRSYGQNMVGDHVPPRVAETVLEAANTIEHFMRLEEGRRVLEEKLRNSTLENQRLRELNVRLDKVLRPRATLDPDRKYQDARDYHLQVEIAALKEGLATLTDVVRTLVNRT